MTEDDFANLREKLRAHGIGPEGVNAVIESRKDRGLGDIPMPGERDEAPWYGNQHTKPLEEPELPFDARSFCQLPGGTIRSLEHYAARRAAETTIKAERAFWLPKLEQWLADELATPTPGTCGGELAKEHPVHDAIVMRLRQEIARLKRVLGIDRQTPEDKRTKTRERVRAFRARHK